MCPWVPGAKNDIFQCFFADELNDHILLSPIRPISPDNANHTRMRATFFFLIGSPRNFLFFFFSFPRYIVRGTLHRLNFLDVRVSCTR